jgi:hypothetical protein
MAKPRMHTIAVATSAGLALVIGAAAADAAVTAAASTTIHGCVNRSTRVLSVPKSGGKCKSGRTAISWNRTGPKGSTGPAGPAGLSLFARVDETGALHQHSAGVTASADPSFAGVYHVHFTQDISGCASVVSQGEAANNGFRPGAFFEAVNQSDPGNTGDTHQVNVNVTNASAQPMTAGFDLILAC